jgi:hypothetical protein
MRVQRKVLLSLAAIATLILASVEGAAAQKLFSRGAAPNIAVSKPPAPSGPPGGGNGGYRGGDGGGRYHGGGWGSAVPGIIMAIPHVVPPSGRFIDDGTVDDRPVRRRTPQRSTRRGPSGAPPANERRLVPDEVVIEVANSVSPQQIDALQRRHRLTRLESQRNVLSGTTLYRWRIPDRRSVAAVIRALEADRVVASAQPNYLFTLQQDSAKAEGDAAQYELAKLHLPQAHTLAKGDNVLVAVVDSGVDTSHPELAGSIADSFDTLTTPMAPHKHGTAIAGLIAAHGRLMGAAPDARILAVRAFNPEGTSAEGTTFNILKGLDWAAEHGARIINMSFAGPNDPAIHRSLAAAHKKGIVLVAAAGNAGPKSPPLYPAADPDVIAVTATDAGDKLFEQSNRGRHIAIAAPGAQIMIAIPDAGYAVESGTSFSAAEISGIVALMLQRNGKLSPDRVRAILLATAKDLGPKGRDALFGAGLADAYGAVMAEGASLTAKVPPPVERASTGAR